MQAEEKNQSLRIDRWLWHSRLYKTRILASEACKKNWVKINGFTAKAAKEVKLGDILSLKLGPLEKIVQVEGISTKRVSAKETQLLWTDLTTPEAYEEAKGKKIRLSPRPLSSKYARGRPTKKQRRELEDFLYPDNDLPNKSF